MKCCDHLFDGDFVTYGYDMQDIPIHLVRPE